MKTLALHTTVIGMNVAAATLMVGLGIGIAGLSALYHLKDTLQQPQTLLSL